MVAAKPEPGHASVLPGCRCGTRWRETEIHHIDLDAGYAHGHWPTEFVDLLLPRVLPTLATRLDRQITVQVKTVNHPHARRLRTRPRIR